MTESQETSVLVASVFVPAFWNESILNLSAAPGRIIQDADQALTLKLCSRNGEDWSSPGGEDSSDTGKEDEYN